MPGPFTIRPATAADANAVLECLHVAFEPYRRHYSAEGFNDTALTPETIHRRLADFTVLVAVDLAGRVVGTIAFSVIQPGVGHLRGMAVLPDQLGCGVAQQLLDSAEDALRKRGCTRITLGTTAPLQRAIRFYERYGYKRSAETGDHFGMPLFLYSKSFD